MLDISTCSSTSSSTPYRSLEYNGPYEEEMGYWALWGCNGRAFGSRGKWRLVVEEDSKGVGPTWNILKKKLSLFNGRELHIYIYIYLYSIKF